MAKINDIPSLFLSIIVFKKWLLSLLDKVNALWDNIRQLNKY